MAETIVCPVCGETNPADMEFCRNCQSRLHPLTGPLKGENSAIQPGEIPTKKVTSELEPILPQWLRDARKHARDTAAEEAAQADQEKKDNPVSESPDLLAGLESQARDDEDETPDWVSHITGTPAKKKKLVPEEGQVKWVELGHGEQQQEPSIDEASSTQPESPVSRDQQHGKDELTDWFKQASTSSQTADYGLPPTAAENLPAAAAAPASEPGPEAEHAQNVADLSWLRNLDTPTPPEEHLPETTPLPREETPDWLKKLQAEQRPPEVPQPPASRPATPDMDVPAWLRSFSEEAPTPPEAEEPAQPPLSPERPLPDWLNSIQASGPEPTPTQAAPDADETATPAVELPDWISSLGHGQEAVQEEPTPNAPAFEAEAPSNETLGSTGAPAFAEEGPSGNDIDAIFASMQMPDWLSAVMPEQPAAAENLPPAAQPQDSIGPAELPSWVQAMRPIESSMAASTGGQEDASPEERGPLAGLQGVLPVIPGAAAPSSKPQAHSIKVDATEQQLAHAALLEQILSAETAPIPMRSGAMLRSQKGLRWVISVLLLLVVGSAVFTGTKSFPLPGAVPNETIGAIRAVESVPADAPVLLIFDYQPSTVGEMEATGASLLDHLLLLKHPHLALLSTSPTGSALAERFMSTTLAQRAYARNVQYVDLGYLPGGLTGVYAFAQNPSATVPLGADSKLVWQSAILSPITRFSDFAAVIVLTDSVEAGRTWIEQTALSRGKSLMVIASSAQAGPMLLPYVDSGQVSGIVSGVNGAVGAEQANGGLPGYVRQYWDAYSLGLYLAVVLIVMGTLWNLWRGMQERRAQAVG
jgi:hypothetical protein